VRDTPFTLVPLEGDLAAALASVPTGAGVGQILGREGRNLLIGRPANLRRWAAGHLGAGRPARKGRRPPTDLRPVAVAVAHTLATSAFHQRLLYERLMSRHVPPSARRDLKPPVFLHLDPAQRFPRVTLRRSEDGLTGLHGPFRDRRAAERARDQLHKLIPLRPCDYVFEPDPALPLGLGCFYAQVRTCAAPCLGRVSEEGYRALAAEAAAFLKGHGRPAEAPAWLPAWISAAAGARGLVVVPGRAGAELYPVREGAVLEEESTTARREELEGALAGLRWPPPATARDDWPWLVAWLHAPRRRGAYLLVAEGASAASLAPRVQEVIT
jgi:hypothetical protein